MISESSLKTKIAAIHASVYRGVFVVTGGGSGLLSALLSVPGASRTVLDAEVPYSPNALRSFLGRLPEHCCAEQTARQMAVVAWQRALRFSDELDFSTLFGFSLTATLATDRPHRGEHRAFAAFHTARQTRAYSLVLQKGLLTREEEEARVTGWALSVLAECLQLEAPEIASLHHAEVSEDWCQLELGKRPYIAVPLRGEPTAWKGIFPGSFAPFHSGHAKMQQIASEILGGEVALELAVRNADKPPLDYVEIQQRLHQIETAPFFTGSTLLLSALPFFQMKAEAFPGTTFVVGTDTLERIADVRFHNGNRVAMLRSHEQLAALGCCFLVFGRLSPEGTFVSLEDLDLPPVLKSLCTGVPESAFRMDISSTELRQKEEHQAG